MKRFFFGGVHPKYKKELTSSSTDFAAVAPARVAIPLRQHIGDACEPLVRVGDRVRVGQKIGDGDGLCVPVHASVSGKVIAIEPRRHPDGSAVESIIIENDFADEPIELSSCDGCDVDSLLHAIREAGIVGLGGAAFPGDAKALGALGKVDTLIANACECEPYITADDALMRTDPRAVLDGMRILRGLLAPERTVVAVEDNKPSAIARLRELASEFPEIEVAVLPTRYPQGAEKQLIQALTGRQVPPGGLPYNVGCVVYNVSTYAAISRAVRGGMPLVRRIVTVSGEAVKTPQNLLVPIGTSFEDAINAAGGLLENVCRVINGGPMMGTAQDDLSVPVVKATNSILCLAADENDSGGTACIRCGRCVAACPMHLQPLYLCRYAAAERVEELERLHISDCMECGCCAYSCPAKLPLVERIRRGKKLVREAEK